MNTLDIASKIIVSRLDYDINNDSRFLIPFFERTKIGFANQIGEIIIPAQFDIVLDDFYHEKSIVRVGNYYSKAYKREASEPVAYLNSSYGLLKSDGSFLLPMEYESIIMPKYCNAITIYSFHKGYAVINYKGDFIVPFGVYNFIDGFDRGYARVKIGTQTNGGINSDSLWGIINEVGNIVLEPRFTNIWNFYDKALEYTKVINEDNKEYEFHFNDGGLRTCGYHNENVIKIKRELNEYHHLQVYRENFDNRSDSYIDELAYYNGFDRGDVESGLADAYENDLNTYCNEF